jgi:hypothetical protein
MGLPKRRERQEPTYPTPSATPNLKGAQRHRILEDSAPRHEDSLPTMLGALLKAG